MKYYRVFCVIKKYIFWINRRDLEIESKRSWQAIFDNCKDFSRQIYRKELTPNITFQPNKIFARNNLFEKRLRPPISSARFFES